jgi:hypothetical protein
LNAHTSFARATDKQQKKKIAECHLRTLRETKKKNIANKAAKQNRKSNRDGTQRKLFATRIAARKENRSLKSTHTSVRA